MFTDKVLLEQKKYISVKNRIQILLKMSSETKTSHKYECPPRNMLMIENSGIAHVYIQTYTHKFKPEISWVKIMYRTGYFEREKKGKEKEMDVR